MYRPHDRARATLMLTVTVLLFVGALALPFLVERDVVRLRFGEDEGFNVQAGGLDDLAKTGSTFDDGRHNRLSRVLVASPASSEDTTFNVSWDNDGPEVGIVYAYHLQYGIIENGADGEITWHDWFRLRSSDQPRIAAFTGDPGATYQFRGRACTLLVACGTWSDLVQTQVAPDAPAPQVVLELTPRGPAAGQIVQGKVALAWQYDHRGPGSAMLDVSLRPTGGGTETPLYSGGGLSAVWDTTRHDDGSYVIRIALSDGAHRVHQEIPVQVRNAPTADADPSHDHAADAAQHDQAANESASDTEEAAALPVLLVAACLAVLALCGRSLGTRRDP